MRHCDLRSTKKFLLAQKNKILKRHAEMTRHFCNFINHLWLMLSCWERITAPYTYVKPICFEKREFWPENGFMNLSVKAEYLCMHLYTLTRSNSYRMTCLLFKLSLQNERNDHGIICKVSDLTNQFILHEYLAQPFLVGDCYLHQGH